MTGQGWECPRCGACYSPFVQQCVNCRGTIPTQVTTTTAPVCAPSAEQRPRGAPADPCGKPAASFIPRWGLSFACVLPKNHAGACQRGGVCSQHGDYVGEHCPHEPNCSSEVPALVVPHAPAGTRPSAAAIEAAARASGFASEDDPPDALLLRGVGEMLRAADAVDGLNKP